MKVVGRSLLTPLRINLWASPRTSSTSLMYSFAQRDNCLVVDEPLYMHYLTNINPSAHRPYREELSKVQKSDGAEVVKDLLAMGAGKEVVFFKHMSKHYSNLPNGKELLSHAKNVLLIRKPEDIIASFEKAMGGVSVRDTGIPQQRDIFRYLQSNGQQGAVCVISYEDIHAAPEAVLRALCQTLGISFDSKMLSWEKGGRKEDGLWAPWWYANTHKGTGFASRERSHNPASVRPEHLPLLQQVTEAYDELNGARLRT